VWASTKNGLEVKKRWDLTAQIGKKPISRLKKKRDAKRGWPANSDQKERDVSLEDCNVGQGSNLFRGTGGRRWTEGGITNKGRRSSPTDQLLNHLAWS